MYGDRNHGLRRNNLVEISFNFIIIVSFYSGDVMKIKDDLMLCKPTIFVSVPRLYHRLYSTIKDKLD